MTTVYLNTLPHQFYYKNDSTEIKLPPAGKDVVDAFRATEQIIEMGDGRVLVAYGLNFEKINKVIRDTVRDTSNVEIFVSMVFANALRDEAAKLGLLIEDGSISEQAVNKMFAGVNLKISSPYTGPGLNKNNQPYVVRFTKDDFPDDPTNKLIGQINYTSLLVYVI